MRPFRVGRWGSFIPTPGPSSLPRQYCPLSRRIADHYSSTSCTRLQFSTSSPASSESDAITLATKPKRGRPPKPSSSPITSSSSPVTPLSSPLFATATSIEQNQRYSTSVVGSDLTSQTSRDASSSVLPSQTEPPGSGSLAPDENGSTSSKSAIPLKALPSPPVDAASKSAKLSALHARLSLPSKFPLETLARTLVDKTADSDKRFNNTSLKMLGQDFLRLYITEYLLCRYPRIPRAVLDATSIAYVGPPALASLASDWGIEAAAEPGGEVDPGLLQFRRTDVVDATSTLKRNPNSRYNSDPSVSHSRREVATLEKASANFIRALVGAIYLHCGSTATYSFFASHILSRKLDISSIFSFTRPERDLSRLCAREGFDPPVARLLSESGRLSRAPVFVVGVFSGRDKLGEGSGPSLVAARTQASIKALKGWYLYSPVAGNVNPRDIDVPSMMEDDRGKGKTWKPVMIDMGEIVV